MPQPMSKARGKLRPGFSTSPAVNVTLFHADCANSGPVIARPTIIASANPPASVRPGCASCGFQLFAQGLHHDEVYAALAWFQPRSNPTTINPTRAAVLVNVKVF